MTRNEFDLVVPIDTYLHHKKAELSRLDFDDPAFDQVSQEIVECYREIARGEAYVVRF